MPEHENTTHYDQFLAQPTAELITRPASVHEILRGLAGLAREWVYDIAEHLTCTEVEAVAPLVELLYGPEVRGEFLQCHAAQDDEGDSHYELIHHDTECEN